MTLVTTRTFQPNTAIQWRVQDVCPKQPTIAGGKVAAKPESHIGSESARYMLGSNLEFGFLSNDIEGGAVHIR